jgi:hypothetical protein
MYNFMIFCFLVALLSLKGQPMVLCYTGSQPAYELTEFAAVWIGAGFEPGTAA